MSDIKDYMISKNKAEEYERKKTLVKEDVILDAIVAEIRSLICEYQDNISRLDWDKKDDWNREWVQKFLPLLHKNVDQMINEIGFENHNVLCLWFQQYLKNGTHGHLLIIPIVVVANY